MSYLLAIMALHCRPTPTRTPSSPLQGPSGLNRLVLAKLVLVCSVHSVGLCACIANRSIDISHIGRGVGGRILECRLQTSSSNGYSLRDMDEIERLATEQLQSCEKYPLPRPGPSDHVSKFVYWLGFDAALRAEVGAITHHFEITKKITIIQAYMALALVHRTRAEKKEKRVGKLLYLDPTEAQRALELYVSHIPRRKASLDFSSAISMHRRGSQQVYNRIISTLPIVEFDGLDDLKFALAMWRALTMQTRIGGVSLAGEVHMFQSMGLQLILLNSNGLHDSVGQEIRRRI